MDQRNRRFTGVIVNTFKIKIVSNFSGTLPSTKHLYLADLYILHSIEIAFDELQSQKSFNS